METHYPFTADDEPTGEIASVEKSFACMYAEANVLQEQVRVWLTEWFGERCDDYEPLCECCKRWKAFDELFGDLP